jgi:hypothetical protein
MHVLQNAEQFFSKTLNNQKERGKTASTSLHRLVKTESDFFCSFVNWQ